MTTYTKEEQLRDYGPDSHFAQLKRLERKRLAEEAAVHRDRRERIATAAMAGMLANEAYAKSNCLSVANVAVSAADALIAELDKEVQP